MIMPGLAPCAAQRVLQRLQITLAGERSARDKVDVRALRLDDFLCEPRNGLLVDPLRRAPVARIAQDLHVGEFSALDDGLDLHVAPKDVIARSSVLAVLVLTLCDCGRS